MKTKLAIAAALLVVGLSSAHAGEEDIETRSNKIWQTEGLRKEDITRVVPSGVKHRIGFYTWLSPNCTADGETIIRVNPEHGKIEINSGTGSVSFKKDSARAKCNEHKVPGRVVMYKSEDKYVGDDTLTLLVIFPSGFAWELTHTVQVR